MSAPDPDEDARDLPYLSYGMFDSQVNGYGGRGYTLADFDESQLRDIISNLAKAGVAQHIPTIVTGPHANFLKNLAILSSAAEGDDDISAAIPKVHLEGPYISSEDGPRGAHSARHVRNPDLHEFEDWQHAAGGKIAMITLAPELPGALSFIEEIVHSGVIVSIGHTAATPAVIRQAIEAGAGFSTHLGNGSHAMIPRHENYIWEQLASDQLGMGIISDGHHLPSAMVRALVRAKGLSRTVLVSDVSRMAGLDPGEYHWGDTHVRIHQDGHLTVVGTPFLAGAGHLLDWAVAHFISFTGCELSEALSLCTHNPARLFETGSGVLERGAPANITTFDYKNEDERLGIRGVWRLGKQVYSM